MQYIAYSFHRKVKSSFSNLQHGSIIFPFQRLDATVKDRTKEKMLQNKSIIVFLSSRAVHNGADKCRDNS